MKKTLLPYFCVAAAALAFASTTFAGYKGSISFTDAERARHLAGLNAIMDTAASCLQEDLSRHDLFIKRYGLSAFYGDNSAFAKTKTIAPDGTEMTVNTTDEEKRDILRQKYKVPETYVQQFLPTRDCPNGTRDCPLLMQPTSCIGITMKCLGRGFERAWQADLWERINAYTDLNGTQGDALQNALQLLGWKIIYWNPNTSHAHQWDLEEQTEYPGDPKHIWGQHEETWRTVLTKQMYYLSHVDDYYSLVDFGRRPPQFIQDVPFFVGIAHLGYHVFPGSYGQIIEGHSTRLLSDPESLQTSPFNPLLIGGGPRGGPYKSGLIAVPPGYAPQ